MGGTKKNEHDRLTDPRKESFDASSSLSMGLAYLYICIMHITKYARYVYCSAAHNLMSNLSFLEIAHLGIIMWTEQHYFFLPYRATQELRKQPLSFSSSITLISMEPYQERCLAKNLCSLSPGFYDLGTRTCVKSI